MTPNEAAIAFAIRCGLGQLREKALAEGGTAQPEDFEAQMVEEEPEGRTVMLYAPSRYHFVAVSVDLPVEPPPGFDPQHLIASLTCAA